MSRLILFDDPQELLDEENRERLAGALTTLPRYGGQPLITSYDFRFSGYISRVTGIGPVDHLEVLPATQLRPTLRVICSATEIATRKALYDLDYDAEEPARNYVDACRTFIENKLADVFEDPAFSTWVKENSHPTFASFLGRLRQELKSVVPQSMFGAPIYKRFTDHPALVDSSPVLQLMNKSHHGRRNEIRAGDVAPHVSALEDLVHLVEGIWDETRRWRRRDKVAREAPTPIPDLQAMPKPDLRLVVCPSLAAFTDPAPVGESQETVELFDSNALDGKTVFYLRRDNFGFAAPKGCLAIVDALASAPTDRSLVIARHGHSVLARRLVRSNVDEIVGLTAETPDPRNRTPKTVFFPQDEVAVHKVEGIVFDHSIPAPPPGSEEAVAVDAGKLFEKVELSFRIVDESAVPLALSGQVVLGGSLLELERLSASEGRLVALSLDDGTSLFKRVGEALPGDLSHIRQFESIGGLGSSQLLAVTKEQAGFRSVMSARLIVGVLYNA